MFEELEVVELTHDIKKHKLKKGDRGTVVFVYESATGRSKAYEVEFIEPNGRTIAVLTLMSEDIRPHIIKDEYVSSLFDPPIYFSTASGTVSKEDIWSQGGVRIKIETPKSEVDKEEFRYQIAAL